MDEVPAAVIDERTTIAAALPIRMNVHNRNVISSSREFSWKPRRTPADVNPARVLVAPSRSTAIEVGLRRGNGRPSRRITL
jgi:hypothetical protein